MANEVLAERRVRPVRAAARARLWASAGGAAQVLFVVAWLVAPWWQPPGYRVRQHSISDMYAAGAPGAVALIVVLAVCGAATVGFAAFAVWPVLRPAGRSAALGAGLLAASNYGLGGVTAAWGRLPCSEAVVGCTAETQLADADGVVHSTVAAAGLLLVVVAPVFLAAAMRRRTGWDRWVWPTRWFAVLFFVLCVIDGLLAGVGWGGAGQRVLAATGAAGILLLAVRVRRDVTDASRADDDTTPLPFGGRSRRDDPGRSGG